MDRSRFRKKVLLDLLSSPWTVLPTALLWSLFLAAWAVGQGAVLLSFLGLGGLLAGLGAMATRWILRGDEISRDAFKELQAEAFRKQAEALDDLDRRLQRDDDPRTETTLRELREIYEEFKKDASWAEGLKTRVSFEIASKVERLFEECVNSLRRSLELWEVAEKMRTETLRKEMLESRSSLLGEISRSLEQMQKTVDSVHALRLEKSDTTRHAQIREELDASLEVARRVEERMRSLEHDLGDALAGSERE